MSDRAKKRKREIKKKKKEKEKKIKINKCPICLEDLDDYIKIKCGHKYHIYCLYNCSIHNIDKCPLCRKEFLIEDYIPQTPPSDISDKLFEINLQNMPVNILSNMIQSNYTYAYEPTQATVITDINNTLSISSANINTFHIGNSVITNITTSTITTY